MTRFALAQETNGFAAPSQHSRVIARLAAILSGLAGADTGMQLRVGRLETAARHDSGAGRDVQDYAVAPPTASARRLHAIAETARWNLPRL